MIFDTINHQNYYQFTYNTRDISLVRYYLIRKRRDLKLTTPAPRNRRRASVPDCEYIRQLLATARSRLSDSLGSLSPPKSPLRHLLRRSEAKSRSARKRTRSEGSAYTKPPYQTCTHVKPQSQASTQEFIKNPEHNPHKQSIEGTNVHRDVVTRIVIADVHVSATPEQAPIKRSTKDSDASIKKDKEEFEGISAVQRSPFRSHLFLAVPICANSSTQSVSITVNPFCYEDTYWASVEEHTTPPSPAPEWPSPEPQSSSSSSMGRMNPLEDHERKIIIEFCHLLEKAKQLFNGLRELPQYGHKQWHSHFGRTFDVYTKLWKFQQRHRDILDAKYGLQRWQIGEIASKIGQLYYHFYLRTSESAYLNEAFSFYEAIRNRSYYTQACKEDKCELMVKKLRYYARFIVVCLLLKKIKLVRELISELDRQIFQYGMAYNPDDQVEWTVVVEEVKAFLLVEPVVNVIHTDNCPLILTHRLGNKVCPQVECSSQMNLFLHEVLIVGSSTTQVKFSELTMDMFRMLQTLEREPASDVPHLFEDSSRQHFPAPSAANSKAYNLENGPRSDNPHKYLLFKPTPSQILVYLASGCNDLPPNGALLLYISADGQIMQPSKHSEDTGYDIGGLITISKNDLYREYGKEQKSSFKYKEAQCIHPGDLYPFTRKPMFIIVDSDNSYVFQSIPRHFGQPLVVLMSPLEMPTALRTSTADRRQQGSLFTLFLHSPLTAFCYTCDISTVPLVQWDRAQAYIDTFLIEAAQIVIRSRIDSMYISFMGDDFLRLLILRYIFCEVTMRMHRAFRARTHLSRASPPVPEDLLEHPALTHIVMDLASHLQVRGHFHDPSASGPPPLKE